MHRWVVVVRVVGKARLGTANEEWGASCSTRVQKRGRWPGGGQGGAMFGGGERQKGCGKGMGRRQAKKKRLHTRPEVVPVFTCGSDQSINASHIT